MEKLFQSKFQSRVVPIMKFVNATKVDHISMWLNPHYLFYLGDSLWFSCSYDSLDDIIDSRLGRLFLFKDFVPSLNVLEGYYDYLTELCEKGYLKKRGLRRHDKLPEGVNLLANTLIIVLTDYKQLSKAIEKKIQQREDNLKPYLIQEISNPEMLASIAKEYESGLYETY